MISVAFGGSITLLPEYDTSIYVSFIGFAFVPISSPSPYEKRRPKRAFVTLSLILVVAVVVLTVSPSPAVVLVITSVVALADCARNEAAAVTTEIPASAIIVTERPNSIALKVPILCRASQTHYSF